MQRAAQILALMAQRKKENLGKFKTIQTQMCISACSEELVQGDICLSGWLSGRLAGWLSLSMFSLLFSLPSSASNAAY